ncbi:HAD-IA family hydrolase [Nocardia aurantia]|uniref:Phosphoglycolate phosphatase n=1 Tax=Nocardia aurantia TaxID=2585199 RepID=A0A7K0DPR1_9NOCA|nr:HAD-IA family hydrolase [Nocardia aurantia]MQY27750.1 Phosphoglycolate phosphatase [Nocardia aurantia]
MAPATIDARRHDAVIFDMDGVVTDSAALHAAAWTELFAEFLTRTDPSPGADTSPFTADDYRRWIDGKPRYAAIRDFLAARGIPVTGGEVRALGDRKNELFLDRMAREGVPVFESTVEVVRRLRADGFGTGLFSASHNCAAVLRAAGIGELFPVRIDGVVAEESALPGKPDPATLLEAAHRLGAAAERTVVVEDSTAGVRAGRAGGFGLVIGVDRGGHPGELRDAGADVVVADLAEVEVRGGDRFACDVPGRPSGSVATLSEGPAAPPSWLLTYDGYDPPGERLRETLCTVGNGYLAVRGAAPESVAGEHHYPGMYVAGIYNRLADEIGGHTVENESLVNLPNWLPVTFRVDGGAWFDLDEAEILSYRQEFDLRRALLTRRFRFRDDAGRVTAVCQRRFAAMHSPHLCALETTVTAENWAGRLEIRTIVDGGVRNTLVARYRELSDRHLETVAARELSDDSVLISVRTSTSRIPVSVAARHIVRREGETSTVRGEFTTGGDAAGHLFALDLGSGDSVTLEKVAAVVTGRDHAVSAPDEDAARRLADAAGFAELLTAHSLAWSHLWDRLCLELDNREHPLRVMRLHLLHVAQTLSPHTADLDAGVPARGLHGEAYRGHIFWDELFVFPILNPRFPALTRALLRYRHRRLPEARRAAAAAGRKGAQFPWQSGSDGREESQSLHLNPLSGRWRPDPSHRAHHIGGTIAYNVWQYYQVTGDIEFLTEYGAELLVDIARFWSSAAVFDPETGRCHLTGVVGPDEFHSGYPDAPQDGVDDNTYTNIMAVWTICHAERALNLLAPRVRDRLLESLGVEPGEPERWDTVSRRLTIPFHDGVLSQFAGYEQLAELDWDHYRRTYPDIRRLDRILESEGDDINRYRAGKQADVLMLFYLLSADEVREILRRLGYDLPGEMIPRTIDYYLARTSHGSTLSAVVHAWVLARADRCRAMRFFRQVLDADIADIQGGTTEEGIHLGAMAGSIDLVQRCFSGLEIRDDHLVLDPQWPPELGGLTFPIVYRGHRLTIRIDTTRVEVRSDPGTAAPVEIHCAARVQRLSPGGVVRWPVAGP